MKPAQRNPGRPIPAATRGPSMRTRWMLTTLLALALLAALGGRLRAEAPPALAVIVNPEVPVTTLSAAELASIFTRATRGWKDGSPIRALNLPPGTAERAEFDRVVLDMSPDRSAQYWIDRQVRGDEPAPKAIGKADIVARLIPTLAGSIGYLPADKVDGKSRVVARIRNGKVVAP
jgi:ABC-type phosphate transport system substrate-binding protein